MSENDKIAKTENTDMTGTATQEETIMPAVDIYEDSNAIRLLADMPGVDDKSVEVTIGNGELHIEGTSVIRGPDGGSLAGQEYATGRFRRGFTLSEEMDTEGVKAKVKNGVLEVKVPKRDEVKTKKIKITN